MHSYSKSMLRISFQTPSSWQ